MQNLTIQTLKGPINVNYYEHVQRIMELHTTLHLTALSYYPTTGLKYVLVPQMVGVTGACEQIKTLYRILNKLNLPLYAPQTGQLALELFQMFYPGVFTIMRSFRDEGVEDCRHLFEFSLGEEEFSWPSVEGESQFNPERMFEHLLQRIESAVRHFVNTIIVNHPDTLEFYGQNTKELLEIIKYPFLRITYDEAIILLQQNGYPELKWGDDLKDKHEQVVVIEMNKIAKRFGKCPVFITHYPTAIKFFNMMPNPKNPLQVFSADLILYGSGESVGSAVREPDPILLKNRLLASDMFRILTENGGTYDDFKWYIEDVVGSGFIKPHAGYGMGFERVIQSILGFPDIRDCAPANLYGRFTGDFDSRRQGIDSILSPAPRTILLSIADGSKAELLPSIQMIANNGIVLYTTSGTHQFLHEHGISTTLVHKISETGKPNLADLLQHKVLTNVINIPSPAQGQTETDGEAIRQLAIDTGTYLITDVLVAKHLFQKLAEKK